MREMAHNMSNHLIPLIREIAGVQLVKINKRENKL